MKHDEEYTTPPEVPGPATPRREYKPPTLTVVGTLDEVVLGGSPGAGDSGPTYETHLP